MSADLYIPEHARCLAIDVRRCWELQHPYQTLDVDSRCGCTCHGAAVIQSCNMHGDCDEADRKAKEKGLLRADHCHDDCCEDCFGC